jgi:hypothetical protein
MRLDRYVVCTRQRAHPYKTEVGKAEGKRPKDLGVNRIIPEYYLLGYNALSACHLVSGSASSTLKMKAICSSCSSETSVEVQRTYIPEPLSEPQIEHDNNTVMETGREVGTRSIWLRRGSSGWGGGG